MNIQKLDTPHKSKRPSDVMINAIIIHDTGGKTALGTIEWFVDLESNVSSHYLIDKDGTTYQFVEDEDKAWHAGVSSLHGIDNVNNFSVGIELVDNNDKDIYPQEQIDSLIELCALLCMEHKIPLNRVVGHKDVAPGRKVDPGNDFPWFEFLITLGATIGEKECQTLTG